MGTGCYCRLKRERKWGQIKRQRKVFSNLLSHKLCNTQPGLPELAAAAVQTCISHPSSTPLQSVAPPALSTFLQISWQNPLELSHMLHLRPPNHTDWCLCVSLLYVSLLFGKIRPHERCSPGDTSGIPGMPLWSCADFEDNSSCTITPPLPFYS